MKIKKYHYLVLLLLNVTFICIGCERKVADQTGSPNKSHIVSKVIDIDGNSYNTVIIGTQEWLSENLNVIHFKNGEIIPEIKNRDEWLEEKSAYITNEHDISNDNKYGKLYNWYAVNDSRGLAPEGWHIPTNEEWTVLINHLGGENVAGGKLKSVNLWDNPNLGATNESGFTAVPCGVYYFTNKHYGIGKYTTFWSANAEKESNPYIINLESQRKDIYRKTDSKKCRYSVRCVKN